MRNLPALLILTASFLLSLNMPAHSETVALFCSWPNHLDDQHVQIDYGAGTVTWYGDRSRDRFGPVRAQISDNEIDWDYWWKNGGDHIFARLSRISGQLTFCDRDTCWSPYACEPETSVQRKF
jgi:hypothetical protein